VRQLYSVFLYSDPTEFELFVGKILTESEIVDHWIVVESCFSFKGRHKAFTLSNLMENEPRIKNFVNRIHLILNEDNFLDEYIVSTKQKTLHNLEATTRKVLNQNLSLFERKWTERAFFYVERRTRDLATDLLLTLSAGEGWVFISDVDEYLERNILADELQHSLVDRYRTKFFKIRRTRYVFDFDNLDYQFRTCPIVDISLIAKRDQYRISEFRERQDAVFVEGVFKVTEFSYCLSRGGILTKLQDFSHEAPPVREIENALRLNHCLRYPDDPKTNITWLQKVKPNNISHPKYVLDNLESLRTGVINVNYTELRKSDYPHLFF
jgi:hypothetical protein